MPENTVDTFAFWICLGIFSVIIGNLIYESLFRNWADIFYFEPKCPEPCCEGGNQDE